MVTVDGVGLGLQFLDAAQDLFVPLPLRESPVEHLDLAFQERAFQDFQVLVPATDSQVLVLIREEPVVLFAGAHELFPRLVRPRGSQVPPGLVHRPLQGSHASLEVGDEALQFRGGCRQKAPSEGSGSAPGGALAAVAEGNHYEQNDDTHRRELQKSLWPLAAYDEGGHEDQGQRRITRSPEGEVSHDQPDQRVQNGHERSQDRKETEGPGINCFRCPQPDLADRDKREEGRDEAYGTALEGYRLGIEAVGLVPAGLTNIVATPGPAPASASGVARLSPQGFVRVLFLPAEAAPQALAQGGTTRFALPALGGELVLNGADVKVEAGKLVGSMGQVERFVVLAATVRVGEDRVSLLQPGEFLRAPAGVVGVTLLRQVAVSVPDLGLGGLAWDAEHLVVVDLVRHRFLILTQGSVRGPTYQRESDLLQAPRVLLRFGCLHQRLFRAPDLTQRPRRVSAYERRRVPAQGPYERGDSLI